MISQSQADRISFEIARLKEKNYEKVGKDKITRECYIKLDRCRKYNKIFYATKIYMEVLKWKE